MESENVVSIHQAGVTHRVRSLMGRDIFVQAYGAMRNIWEAFGATAVGIYPGRTSQQAGGNKAGTAIRFTNDDMELMRNVVPLAKHFSRVADVEATVQNGSRSFKLHVN